MLFQRLLFAGIRARQVGRGFGPRPLGRDFYAGGFD